MRHAVQDAAKPRSTLLVHAYGHEVTGLKTYRGPKRKDQLGLCSIPGFYPQISASDLMAHGRDNEKLLQEPLRMLNRSHYAVN